MRAFLGVSAAVGLAAVLSACGGGGGGAKDKLVKESNCAHQKEGENSRMSELQRKEADGTITPDEKSELDGIYAKNKQRSTGDGSCDKDGAAPAGGGAQAG